jgi:hypothetical protein
MRILRSLPEDRISVTRAVPGEEMIGLRDSVAPAA